MSSTPIIPLEVLEGIDDVELRQRAGQLQLAVDVDSPEVRPLLWSLAFKEWPDLFRAQDLSELTRFYNQYFWYVRFISDWQAAHGGDAGLEDYATRILERAPHDIDWKVVERLDHQARYASGPDPG